MRLGIKVPNELLQQMEPFKHGANISQICRDAITNWVDGQQRARLRAGEDHMDEKADRLSGELAEQLVDWERLGHEDAKQWVELASLKHFENLFHNLLIFQRQGRSPAEYIPVWGHIPGTKTFWDRWGEHHEWFIRQIERDETTDHHREARAKYNLSWLWYVSAVWQMVKERLAAEAEVRDKVRDEACAQIEVPAHLTKAARAE